jgi:hypothetical protein
MRWRILAILMWVAFLKITFAILLYNMPGETATSGNFYGAETSFSWLYLFAAWDSGYYISLAADWYPSWLTRVWAYFPLYPACIRLVGLLGLNLWLAGFLIAQIAGFASILVFQKVSSQYLGEVGSLSATALYFLLPPVFVFTTVIYSESLFLLLSLTTWYAHVKGKSKVAAIFASLTALTRAYGLLILLPMGYDMLRRKQFRKLRPLGIPIATFIGWLSYSYLRTGNAVASFAAQSYWNTPIVSEIRNSIRFFLLSGDLRVLGFLQQFQLVAVIGGLLIVPLMVLCVRVWKIDRSLGVFSGSFVVAISLVAVSSIQGLISLPRYLSFIFPVGMALKTRRKWLLSIGVAFLSILDIVGWWLFLFTSSFH